MKICLVTIAHDPDGKLFSPTTLTFPAIQDLFYDCQVKVTPSTDRRLTEYLSCLNVPVINANTSNSEGRLIALKTAYSRSQSDLFFYIDFDRLIYWQTVYPGELRQVVKSLTDELTVIGRTKAAFESHPKLQQLTEKSANLIFSQWYGKDVDILTGCRVIPRKITKQIIQQSLSKNMAYMDAEWLMIANKPFRYFEVNGLGYEHYIFNLCKPQKIETRTRVENLHYIMECVLND